MSKPIIQLNEESVKSDVNTAARATLARSFSRRLTEF